MVYTLCALVFKEILQVKVEEVVPLENLDYRYLSIYLDGEQKNASKHKGGVEILAASNTHSFYATFCTWALYTVTMYYH